MCYYSKLKGKRWKCRCCFSRSCKGSEADPRPMPKLMASCVVVWTEWKWIVNHLRVQEARKSVTEFLLINHPLDCPVCDQAGECDLQNLLSREIRNSFYRRKELWTRKYWSKYSIAHEPLYSLLPLCDGCRSITNWRVHGVMDRDHSNISTCISKAVDNEFSGNMIDVCP
jgi:NADH-quinone oxidoreductase subunit G